MAIVAGTLVTIAALYVLKRPLGASSAAEVAAAEPVGRQVHA